MMNSINYVQEKDPLLLLLAMESVAQLFYVVFEFTDNITIS